MNLLTKEIRKEIPLIGSQDQETDPIAHVKFFCPWNSWTWYATEFDGEDIFFGKVIGFETELGSFSLSELQNVIGPAGITIERDIHFSPKPLSECK